MTPHTPASHAKNSMNCRVLSCLHLRNQLLLSWNFSVLPVSSWAGMFEFWDVCVRLLDQHCFCMQINMYRNASFFFDYSVLFNNNYSHKIETWHADCNMNVTFWGKEICHFHVYYTKNQQYATLAVLFLVTARSLYMFRTLSASIIRSTKNCSSSHWCMSWVGMMYMQ